MLKRHFGVGVAISTLLVLTSCSSSPKATVSESAEAKQAAAPPSPIAAKEAFWEMYMNARKNWTTDFVLLQLTSKDMPGFKSEAGKAPIWEGTFGSPGRHEYRVYSYAITAYPPDIYKGVTVGRAFPWNGITRDVMGIQTSDFNTDSDAAYQAAATDASAWLKKHPDKKLTTFQLGNAYKFPAPVWHLMWGDKKSGYVVFVNASTGKPVKAT